MEFCLYETTLKKRKERKEKKRLGKREEALFSSRLEDPACVSILFVRVAGAPHYIQRRVISE